MVEKLAELLKSEDGLERDRQREAEGHGGIGGTRKGHDQLSRYLHPICCRKFKMDPSVADENPSTYLSKSLPVLQLG